MRVIIIDDSKEYMVVVRHMLAELQPDVEVTEYDPEQIGKPNPEFDWSFYDLVILDDRLGGIESGLDWFAEFSRHPAFPDAIVLTETDDGLVAAKAASVGSTEYLSKENLSKQHLQAALKELGLTESDATKFDPPPGSKLDLDRQIVGNMAIRSTEAEAEVETSYRFVRLIGQGSHSRVYLAERSGDKLTMVLKVMDLSVLDDPTVAQRFEQEAVLLASIDSPFVVKFYDHGFTPSYGYIAIEFFTRGDLKQRIEHGISPGDALIYALHIAYGLEAIHTKEIVHRDLKPGNLMCRSDDSLALADFGISKRLDAASDLTKTGSILGTLNYLSPEQGLGKRVDQRSDLYGAGMILFEMLTGRKAFHATSPGALVYQHLHADVPKLPEQLKHVQPIVDSLLAKDPDDRYQTASELVVNLLPFCPGA